MWFSSVLITGLLACSLYADNVAAREHGRFGQRARDHFDMDKRSPPVHHHQKRSSHDDFRFLKKDTKPYLVDSLPDVPFDVGELYSGLVPIEKGNDSRALFFVFQPTIGEPVDEITVWLNGGPGCSSLEGFLQENGRFTWAPGTYAPVENQYSWVNLTNMLWVDQPVGTGFSVGKPIATSQEETAAEFVKFFKNFQELFGIKKFKIYVTGESYAGRYVPYVSAAMLDQKDTDYFDLKGALVYDPCIGQFDYVQEEASTVPYVQANANLFNFNESFLAELESKHKSCGYQDFIDEYLVFPASGVQPPKPYSETSRDSSCDLFDLVNDAVMVPNPCFDVYEINVNCPLPWDVLAFPTALSYEPSGATVYFDRADVKKAMHAPNLNWSICSNENVFVGGNGVGPEGEGDTSANPIESVLPQVIEATNRVLISNGDYDMIILTNGTLMSIQNMTWNGKLGFETAPSTPIQIDLPDLQWAEVLEENGYEPTGQGIMGIQHYERGLMWAETYQSGHMQPQYQPRVAYRHLQWLLGRVESL